jgi:signal peptidase I
MPSITEQASMRNRGLLIGIAVAVGLCLVAAIVYLPSSFREAMHTRAFTVASESMEPTLYRDDGITVDRGYYANHPIADGDIIAFRHSDTILVKRVLAVGGETIQGQDGKLIRNGGALSEPYLKTPDEPSDLREATFGPLEIDNDELFVAGDWRSRSLDSREPDYAPVHKSDVVGKVIYVYSSSRPNQRGRRF